MDWVVPSDDSSGAGTDACVQEVLAIVTEQGREDDFAANLESLEEGHLSDQDNAFAQCFIELVRDVYYSLPGSGAWSDIGFKVTDP
ncbi:MAG: hypothetical protein JSS65_10885 [Armatimonadetes bacterium]|nr:hypothetical protein [Armatimonadota bacterium]